MKINELNKKESLIKKYPKVEEWVKHKQSFEHMSMIAVFEDYWNHISKMIEKDIIEIALNKIEFKGQGIGELINKLHPNKIAEITVSPESIIVSLKEAIKLTNDVNEVVSEVEGKK